MKNDKIVIINGREYDKDTGLPVKSASKRTNESAKNLRSLKAVQAVTSKSKALYSRTAQKTFSDIRSSRRKISHNMDIQKSKQISHFAPDKASKEPDRIKKNPDIKATAHPMATKVEALRRNAKTTPLKPVVEKSAKDIKNDAIAEALNKATKPKNPKNSFFIRNKKYINIFSICAALLIIVGCFIYINLDNISFQFANMQAGISATYPGYYPDGYSVDGPVSYSSDEVTINFRANTGDSKFTINQSKSLLDESALKIQVDQASNNQTSELQEGGLTVYAYNDNNNAEWVNGGILYTITGNAKLSSDQILQIATNM
ncbi:MAG TPA: DUF4367 domain-containing protein [Candidatus Saccharimonadales bacterium]|nr:DUF4367 domain-containing protein [Candidatus Saccharimonadales bacterium]